MKKDEMHIERLTAALIAFLDRALLAFYGHFAGQARRILRLTLAVLPLMLLLVGSCKTEDLPAAYGSNHGAEQFRIALFPDRVNFKGDHYKPAAGYVARARTYVSGDPSAMKRLTFKEVGYLFGKPVLDRKDADANVWQYRAKDCVVDVYFYSGNVNYVDFRDTPQKKQGKCLSRVADATDAG